MAQEFEEFPEDSDTSYGSLPEELGELDEASDNDIETATLALETTETLPEFEELLSEDEIIEENEESSSTEEIAAELGDDNGGVNHTEVDHVDELNEYELDESIELNEMNKSGETGSKDSNHDELDESIELNEMNKSGETGSKDSNHDELDEMNELNDSQDDDNEIGQVSMQIRNQTNELNELDESDGSDADSEYSDIIDDNSDLEVIASKDASVGIGYNREESVIELNSEEEIDNLESSDGEENDEAKNSMLTEDPEGTEEKHNLSIFDHEEVNEADASERYKEHSIEIPGTSMSIVIPGEEPVSEDSSVYSGADPELFDFQDSSDESDANNDGNAVGESSGSQKLTQKQIHKIWDRLDKSKAVFSGYAFGSNERAPESDEESDPEVMEYMKKYGIKKSNSFEEEATDEETPVDEEKPTEEDKPHIPIIFEIKGRQFLYSRRSEEQIPGIADIPRLHWDWDELFDVHDFLKCIMLTFKFGPRAWSKVPTFEIPDLHLKVRQDSSEAKEHDVETLLETYEQFIRKSRHPKPDRMVIKISFESSFGGQLELLKKLGRANMGFEELYTLTGGKSWGRKMDGDGEHIRKRRHIE